MRKPRIKQNGATYHVTARINRQELIFQYLEFKELFIVVMKEAKNKFSFCFRNFCIMGNHVHLDIEPLAGTDLSKLMQWTLSVFAKRYNIVFGYKGHVWYDRFKSRIIKTVRQYINTFFYIANNPIRAGLVNHPYDFAYNGLTFHKNNKDPGLLDPVHDWMKPLIEEFLKKFTVEKYQKTRKSLSFHDKKPGRPRKKR
ncbi:MAG: transposase [Candidatus Margulisbacteria bacterium]|nr:transposase [Candidatus Margulisiibacteriota bacterium]